MKIPGITASHQTITDVCRENRGDDGAFEEAMRRILLQYEACIEGWKGTSGVQFHLVLSVEKPGEV